MPDHPENPHITTAERILRAVSDDIAAEEDFTDPMFVAAATLAQTAATLALTHEQAGTTAAVRALAHEQHQRNRLAAITAHHRGLTLPATLTALAEETP